MDEVLAAGAIEHLLGRLERLRGFVGGARGADLLDRVAKLAALGAVALGARLRLPHGLLGRLGSWHYQPRVQKRSSADQRRGYIAPTPIPVKPRRRFGWVPGPLAYALRNTAFTPPGTPTRGTTTLDASSLATFVIAFPALIFSLVAHEYAHAVAAYRQGDDTAYMLGRITLNPLPHIDPIMSIAFPAITFLLSGGTFVFGGAKPVPVNPRKYRNYKKGDIIVSAAGVATNFVLVFRVRAAVRADRARGADGALDASGVFDAAQR